MSAIIDSNVWVEAMRQCRGKAVECKMTPLRMMIERMPGNTMVILESVICKLIVSSQVYFPGIEPTYTWHLCTDVAAKVLNRCTLSDPDKTDTVVFDYQFLEDFRRDNGKPDKQR